jgi:acetyl esterase/lipase
MAFTSLYWNAVRQQLHDHEVDTEDSSGAAAVHIPASQSNPIYNSAKVCLLGMLTSIFESKVLYASPTSRVLTKTPRDFYMPNYEDVEITTKDKKTVHGWLIKRREARACPTIIHFHGNACNVSHMLYDALGMFQKVKANIMLLDYRGYGQSEGSPSQAGLVMDAEAALDYLLLRRDVVDPDQVFLFGRSLGGAVAMELASRREPQVRSSSVCVSRVCVGYRLLYGQTCDAGVEQCCAQDWRLCVAGLCAGVDMIARLEQEGVGSQVRSRQV